MFFSSKLEPANVLPLYPILYKNKSKDKVIKWEVKIEPVLSPANIIVQYNIIVTFGEINGKSQIHTTVIEKGKANRTIHQQAVLEANSKWNEKHNRDGYRTDYNISLNNSVEKEESNDLFSPMLANTFNENHYLPSCSNSRNYKIPFPAFVQKKYDGIRCVAFLDSQNNVVLQSRKCVKFTHFTNIESSLKSLFEQVKECTQPLVANRFIFDGELYCDSIPFETINGCVRITKNVSNEDLNNINKIQYHIYDCYINDNPNAIFKERMEILKNIFEKTRRNDNTGNIMNYIHEVKTEIVCNVNEIKLKHAEYVKNGFEGIMIRDANGIYEPNKRSKYLQKYKVFMEEEFEIVGFHDGEGVDKDLVIWECITKQGQIFSVRPRASFEERNRLFKEAINYIGKQLTVIFQEYSPDLIPRFPVGKAIREGV
jgi:ATP-dependent DNA ligase